MLIAVDFDGVIVGKNRQFADVLTPFQPMPYAKEGLKALKAAGHTLLLYSARSNRALLYTPEWDPLVRAGVKRPNEAAWTASKDLHWSRFQQMLEYVQAEFKDVFDAIDDGLQGKPMADLFIDDRAAEFSADGHGWFEIAQVYGDPTGQERT